MNRVVALPAIAGAEPRAPGLLAASHSTGKEEARLTELVDLPKPKDEDIQPPALLVVVD